VLRAFEHAWKGYKDYAWLKDEVTPMSAKYSNPLADGLRLWVDSLDTLWIMGLKKEFEGALAVLDQIDFTTTEDKDINVFEQPFATGRISRRVRPFGRQISYITTESDGSGRIALYSL